MAIASKRRAVLDAGGGRLRLVLRREGDLLDRAALGRAVTSPSPARSAARASASVTASGLASGGGVDGEDRRSCGIPARGSAPCAPRRSSSSCSAVGAGISPAICGRQHEIGGRRGVRCRSGGAPPGPRAAPRGRRRSPRPDACAPWRPRCSPRKPASDREALRRSLIEEGAVELAVGAAEIGVFHDRARDRLVGHAEAEGLGLFGHHGFRDQAGEYALVDAEGAGLLRGDDGRGTGGRGAAARYCRRSGTDRPRSSVLPTWATTLGGVAAENVADAPDREADDQKAEKDRGDDLSGQALPGEFAFLEAS